MPIIKSYLQDETELYIETDDGFFQEESREKTIYRGGFKPVSKIIDSGKHLLNEAIVLIRKCAVEIAGGINNIDEPLRPDEAETTMAFKLNGELGAMITKISGEAQMQVRLVWKKQR